MGSIQIGDVTIHEDARGRYSLNDLHRAAGGEARHQPAQFLRIGPTQALIRELERERAEHSALTHSAPLETVNGGPERGTYACRELVYAYAMWVDPVFHLRVIRVFDAVARAAQAPVPAQSEALAFPIPKTYAEALRLAAAQAERLEEQAAQLEAQRHAVDFLERYVETRSTKSVREVAKVLGLRERAFVKQLEDDGVCFRQSGRLLPAAEYQHRGFFEVFTGESRGHAFLQLRFTPAGIVWAAKRYAGAQEALELAPSTKDDGQK